MFAVCTVCSMNTKEEQHQIMRKVGTRCDYEVYTVCHAKAKEE